LAPRGVRGGSKTESTYGLKRDIPCGGEDFNEWWKEAVARSNEGYKMVM